MQKLNSVILGSMVALLGIVVLLLCIFLLPSLSQESARIHPEVAYLQYPILLGMYATAVPFLYAIYEAVKIIVVIERESIFSSSIVYSLNTIKYCALVIIVFYIFGISVLSYANALVPIIAVLGFSIITVTIIVATAATFIKHVIIKNLSTLCNDY